MIYILVIINIILNLQSNLNYYLVLFFGILIDEFSYFLVLHDVFASDLVNFLSDYGDYLVVNNVCSNNF